MEFPIMQNLSSYEMARYIEATDGISKPWLLIQLRLLKLKEAKNQYSESEYLQKLDELHQDLMNLGEWWVGIESEVFEPRKSS
jgi:hypothetical protein